VIALQRQAQRRADPVIEARLAAALLKQGNRPAALAALKRALALNPDDEALRRRVAALETGDAAPLAAQ
jgi:hypothetical protein